LCDIDPTFLLEISDDERAPVRLIDEQAPSAEQAEGDHGGAQLSPIESAAIGEKKAR
jgi:hypothetical protein